MADAICLLRDVICHQNLTNSVVSRFSMVVLLGYISCFCCSLIDIIYLLQSSKGAKIYNAAVAATVDGQKTGREGDEKLKMHTQSYCCLDYSQVLNSLNLHKQKNIWS